MTVVLGIPGFVLIAAVMILLARMPLRPGAYVVRRGAQSQPPLWTPSLVPSRRELPGRPSAAATERRVYVITDLPAAHEGARASERN